MVSDESTGRVGGRKKAEPGLWPPCQIPKHGVIEGNEFSEGGNCYVSQGLVRTGDLLTYSKFKARFKAICEYFPTLTFGVFGWLRSQ